MSIINDALNKAGQAKDIKPEVKIEKPPTPAIPPYQEPMPQKISQDESQEKALKTKGIKSHPIIYAAGVFCLLLAGFAIFKYLDTDHYPVKTVSISEIKSATASSGDTTNSEHPGISVHTATDTSGFLLTGIIHGEGDSIAIVNGSVYMTGDMIGSAKIFKITENTVIVEDGAMGTMLELKVE